MIGRIRRVLSVLGVVAAAATLVAIPTVALAQVVSTPEAGLPAIDWTKMAVDSIAGLTSVLVFLVVWGFKAAWQKIPASVVLFATPVAGVVLNYALNYLAGHTLPNPVLAALAGVGAVALREILTTFVTKGISGTVTPTKLNF